MKKYENPSMERMLFTKDTILGLSVSGNEEVPGRPGIGVDNENDFI